MRYRFEVKNRTGHMPLMLSMQKMSSAANRRTTSTSSPSTYQLVNRKSQSSSPTTAAKKSSVEDTILNLKEGDGQNENAADNAATTVATNATSSSRQNSASLSNKNNRKRVSIITGKQLYLMPSTKRSKRYRRIQIMVYNFLERPSGFYAGSYQLIMYFFFFFSLTSLSSIYSSFFYLNNKLHRQFHLIYKFQILY